MTTELCNLIKHLFLRLYTRQQILFVSQDFTSKLYNMCVEKGKHILHFRTKTMIRERITSDSNLLVLHNMERGRERESLLKITDYKREYFTFSGFVENKNYLQICDRLLHTVLKRRMLWKAKRREIESRESEWMSARERQSTECISASNWKHNSLRTLFQWHINRFVLRMHSYFAAKVSLVWL